MRRVYKTPTHTLRVKWHIQVMQNDLLNCLIFSIGVPCNSISTATSGVVKSTNYPDNYPVNEDCFYVIDVPDIDGVGIRIDFMDFSVEPNYDFLYYGEGTDASDLSTALGSLTGGGRQPPIEIEGGAMWLRFISDGSISQRGFNLTWTSTSPQGVYDAYI